MLRHLYISNFTLIDELDIAFYPGFSVITGETGAGKSIIIGAVGLLMGNRADAKQIKTGRNKCVVEATYTIDDHYKDFFKEFIEAYDLDDNAGECTMRREVSASGKSRAFINDTPVVLTTLRELAEKLMDIHSQHQNLLLNKEDFQLEVIDTFARNKNLLGKYQASFSSYNNSRHALEKLRESIAKSNENEDFLRFQQKELTEANLEEGEQERLERQCELMTHAEEVKNILYCADETLSNDETGIVNQLKNMVHQLQGIETVYREASDFRERMDNCFIELKDLSREISNSMEDVNFDQEMLQKVNSRLDTIYTLEKKYHANSVSDLLSKLDEINAALSLIDNYDEELAQEEKRTAILKDECEEQAALLTETRRKAAMEVEKELSKHLAPLGIPNVRFKVDLTRTENLKSTGTDKIVFLFSSNSGMSLQPISQVASGGEISRVMLSLKAMMSNATGLPTIIFDEIDTGVSGRIAEKMAHIMREMGNNNHQVICITHLPQIAAVGTHHYKVAKHDTADGTTSTMTLLSADDRINEIAQMLSGSDITEAAIENAKSLLNK